MLLNTNWLTVHSTTDKPPIEDLQYFLDFQIARVWAPEHSNVQRKEPVCPSLQFSLMGPKLYISPDQVFFKFLKPTVVDVIVKLSCTNIVEM